MCLLAAGLVTACDGAVEPRDAGIFDAGIFDAGISDAGSDAGISDAGASDAGSPDAGSLDAGPTPLGVVMGDCGEIDDAELLAAGSFAFAASLDFPTAPTAGYDDGLSDGARELLDEGTVGGSSIVSEAMAYEVLARCEMAALLLSESEVEYTAPDGGPAGLTDMVVELDGHRVGVSVVRAFIGGPSRETNPYDATEASRILGNKLSSIRASSDNVIADHGWVKQILVVIALRPDIGETIEASWETFSEADRDGTVLFTVVTNGEDDFIYDNTLP